MHHVFPGVPPSPGTLMMGYGKDGRWTVLAPPDPVIHVSGQLLRELHDGPPDFVTVECTAECRMAREMVPGWCLNYSDIIRIRGDDCHIVYVVRDVVHDDPETWEASWPD
jgi:hypothetical protein